MHVQEKAKKIIKTIMMLGTCAILACTAPDAAVPAKAAEVKKVGIGSVMSGKLQYGRPSDTYTLKVSKTGLVKIDAIGEGNASATLSIVSGLDTVNQLQLSSYQYSCAQVLNAGDYNVTVQLDYTPEYPEDTSYVNYKFSTSVTPVYQDLEPNNDITKAVPMSKNVQKQGSLTYQDEVDVYRIVTPKKSDVTITVASAMYSIAAEMSNTNEASVYYTLKNTKYDELLSGYASGSVATPNSSYQTITLEKGTYYLYITRVYDTYVGNYTCKWSSAALATKVAVSGPKQIALNKSGKLKATVSPADAADKKIYWYSSDNTVATVDTNTGKVQPVGCGSCTIYAILTSNENIRKAYKVTVVPPAVSLGTVTNKKSKALTVSWNQKKNVTGYQVQYTMKSQNFSKGVSSKMAEQLLKEGTSDVPKSKNSITVKNLKKGKTYYVRIRAYYKDLYTGKKYYSDWSKVKKVKIKK